MRSVLGNVFMYQGFMFLGMPLNGWMVGQVLEIGDKFPKLSELKDVSLFLTVPNCLGMDKGMGLYVKSHIGEWAYRGYVSSSHPSEVMPLQVGFESGRRACARISIHCFMQVVGLLDQLVVLQMQHPDLYPKVNNPLSALLWCLAFTIRMLNLVANAV